MKQINLTLIIYLLFYSQIFGQTKQEELNTAVSIFNEANTLKIQYKLDEAAVKYNQAAAIFQKYDASVNYIKCKYSEGETCLFSSKFDEAENIYTSLIVYANEKLGEDAPILINVYYGLGTAAFYRGNHNKAYTYYKKAIALNEKLNAKKNIQTANLYSGLGNIYSERGQNDSALIFYNKDLQLRDSLTNGKDPQLARTYANVAIAYQGEGQYDKAIQSLERALQINVQTGGENHPDNAGVYSTMASIYLETGQLELALEYCRKSLEMKKQIFGEKHLKVITDYILLGNILLAKENYNEALVAYKNAYNLISNIYGDNHPDIGLISGNIGQILMRQGKYESANAYFEIAVHSKIQYHGENHPTLASYYNNMGLSYEDENKDEKAILYFNRAIDILKSNYGNKYPGLVKMYANIGNLYYEKAEYNKALLYFQKSLTANVKKFNPDSADVLSNPVCEDYYDINKLLISLDGKAKTLYALSIKDNNLAYGTLAYETIMLCDPLVSVARKTVVSKNDKIALSAKSRNIYENAVKIAVELSKKATSQKQKQFYIERAFYFSEKNKAGVLSDAISAAEAKNFSGIPPEMIEKEKKLNERIAGLEKSIAEISEQKKEAELRNQLFAEKRKLQKLSKTYETDYPEYYQMKYADKTLDINDIKSQLADNEAVLSYLVGDESIYVFCLTTDKTELEVKRKPADFEQQVEALRKVMTSGYRKDIEQYIKKAYDFYRIIFPTITDSEIEHLNIIPDGILGIIPFEALFTDSYSGELTDYKDYPFLIKKYQINYFYSADLFYRTASKMRKHKENRKKWLGIAPVFDSPALIPGNARLAPLPGTVDELTNITALFGNDSLATQSRIRKTANEKFVKSDELSDYKYIHIATHGVVNSETPELSRLYLSADAQDANDDILYSGEIYNLDLDADLVVLSACETGLGKVSKGEGIIGLSRALLYAGADNLIVSLWKVSDKSTAVLMVDFYDALLNSQSEDFSEALYQAKLKMIQNGSFAHPFFWSPFILIGK